MFKKLIATLALLTAALGASIGASHADVIVPSIDKNPAADSSPFPKGVEMQADG